MEVLNMVFEKVKSIVADQLDVEEEKVTAEASITEQTDGSMNSYGDLIATVVARSDD